MSIQWSKGIDSAHFFKPSGTTNFSWRSGAFIFRREVLGRC